MADYIYLLQTRLTAAQQAALNQVREVARSRDMTVFLVGGAVRDLTSGSPVRDLDVVVQGNAISLRKEIINAGATIAGEDPAMQALHLRFPGGVRLELGSTLSVSYPKPGKAAVSPATILEDLRRRDFTANAMAISLNEGSFGLLMDPLNGVADIENRELRLVSNYGFIEEPSRMIRAARLQARLGWQLEERTAQRYETGKAEGYISALGAGQRAYELEELFHEEDPLRVIRRLEAEGWMAVLSPSLTSAKANEAELDRLHDTVGQLEQMGIHPDSSAAHFPLLTARLSAKEAAALTASFARPGFAEQIAALDNETKAFAAQFTSKAAAAPSQAWKLLFSANSEAVLWLAHTSKSGAVQAKFKSFFNEWSQAKQKIPYQLMQEMRITPDLPGYEDLLDTLFFAIMDGKLDTPEAAKAFLEPYSPPAPPPPINLRRRPAKRETKAGKARPKKGAESAEVEELAPAGESTEAGSEVVPAAGPTGVSGEKTAPVETRAAAKAAGAEPAEASGQPAKGAARPEGSGRRAATSAPALRSGPQAEARQKPEAAGAGKSRSKAAEPAKAATASRPAKKQEEPSASIKGSAHRTKKASAPAATKGKGAKVASGAKRPSGKAKSGPAKTSAKAGTKVKGSSSDNKATAKKAAAKNVAKTESSKKKSAPGKKAARKR